MSAWVGLPVASKITESYETNASPAAMSIDFGSQWIKMALVKPGVPMEVVLNEEAHRKTPNLIIIKDNERLFGDAALAYSVKHSKNSFTYLVDLLGKKIDNPIVSLYKQRFPYLNLILDDTRGVMQFDVDGEAYSIESIVAMILRRCREVVEKFAKQPVRDVVITVPAFFNQAERRALVAAAEIAELNLLQLLNDHTAAGLNYGAFRRKEITESTQTLLIYDVGATKVTASVLEYILVEEKKRGEKNPVMTTLGAARYLCEQLSQNEKTKTDITKNPRSMAKMLQEAEHVKIVLSANVDFTAQIENVHEEQDFTMLVTRTMLEDTMRDLEVKLVQPIVDALKMADLLPEQINQVVLMGGGSRVPLIQEFERIGKFLNTDEAIAMGAVYQAAHLSKGFKVKKFGIRDLQIFPIQEFGSLNISEIKISGVTDIYIRETAKEGTIFKGIKTHFYLDNSGILHVDGAEMLLEQPPKAESTLALSDKSHNTVDVSKNQTKIEKLADSSVSPSLLLRIYQLYGRIIRLKWFLTSFSLQTATSASELKQEEKPQQIKISLKMMESKMDLLAISDSEIIAAKNRIYEFERKEHEKAIREEAHHNLESLAVDLSDKLNQDEFNVPAKKVSQVKAWLDNDIDINTPTTEFIQNKKTIDELLRPIEARMTEDQERPLMVAELISMFNHTEIFLLLAQNLSKADVFTEDWLAERIELQNKLKPTDPPALAVSEGKEKLRSLDREVKYLLNKMKFAKPRVDKEEKTKEWVAESNETLPETTEESKTVSEERSDEMAGSGPPIENAAGIEKNEELKNGEQKDDIVHDASEL
ncbi:alpha-1,2-Mannosidase [Dirofilaria immitis]|nr:alpha-1,2-Mannosidase [Dirofilaria immitis]